MAIFPKVQPPCPYQDNLAAIMDGDVCRMCKREVFDLTAMDDHQRVAFLRSCSGEVCVSYRLPARIALAAALATAAMAAPVAAAAQDDATLGAIVVVAGGIKDPANVKLVETASDTAAAELPTVYDDAPAQPATPSTDKTIASQDQTPAAPASRNAS